MRIYRSKSMVKLTIPELDDADIGAALEVLRSKMLTQGPQVAELEGLIQDKLLQQDVRMVSNGTASLHIALETLNLEPGDEVIVPAFSYIASANVVELVRAKPVFVDVSLSDFNLLADQVEQKISSRTKAILPVHEFGMPCDIQRLVEIAKHHKLFVIEDAACALGSTVQGQPVGTFGDFGSFSLHPRKLITTGEGGILTAKDSKYITEIEMLRSHGQTIIEGRMEFLRAGFNYRMTDFQAALLVGQVNRIEQIIENRRTLVDQYFSDLDSIKDIRLPGREPEGAKSVWQSFHILTSSFEERESLKKHLMAHDCQANLGAQCIPAQSYYEKKYGYTNSDFPNAYEAFTCGLVLPLYSTMKSNDVDQVCKAVRSFYKK